MSKSKKSKKVKIKKDYLKESFVDIGEGHKAKKVAQYIGEMLGNNRDIIPMKVEGEKRYVLKLDRMARVIDELYEEKKSLQNGKNSLMKSKGKLMKDVESLGEQLTSERSNRDQLLDKISSLKRDKMKMEDKLSDIELSYDKIKHQKKKLMENIAFIDPKVDILINEIKDIHKVSNRVKSQGFMGTIMNFSRMRKDIIEVLTSSEKSYEVAKSIYSRIKKTYINK